MTSLQNFLAELKRRKVYRVAIVYAAVAAVVWQAADIAFPPLGLPDSAVTFVLVLTLLGFPVAMVLAWAYELKPEGESPTTGPALGSSQTPDEAASPNSIAILPFENMSTEAESEYFADGIAEELTHALGRFRSLRVAARTSSFSFKGEPVDVRDIGARLNVAHVVEGSVRRAGDRLRVTAQLIDTANGYHVWSDRFEREIGDVFAIQDDIVAAVVESLLERLSVEEAGASPDAVPVLSRTDDLAAYDLYLKGRHELGRYDGPALANAVGFLEQAVSLDPTFSPGFAALAEALTMQALGFYRGPQADLLPRARQAADRALALNPNLPAAHLARALTLLYHDWAFPDAKAELDHAIRLNPSAAEAHRWTEFYWSYIQRDYEQALASLARAEALDPLDGRLRSRRGAVHYLFGRYEKSEAIFRAMLATDPTAIALIGLMDTLIRAGRPADAVAVALDLEVSDEVPDAMIGVAGRTLGLAGETERSRKMKALLDRRFERGYSSPFWRATARLGLKELDEAFALFEEAFAARDGAMMFLSTTPKVPGFQEDPRYADLLRRMGLGHLVPTG